jgi:hypothetical protein
MARRKPPREKPRGWECEQCGHWNPDYEAAWCTNCRRVRPGTAPDDDQLTMEFSIDLGAVDAVIQLLQSLHRFEKKLRAVGLPKFADEVKAMIEDFEVNK